MREKVIASQQPTAYLLVNRLVSTVNLTILTRALLWKALSVPFRLLISWGYPDQSQFWMLRRKVSTVYIIDHCRSDKDI
jgi:hypothetical protein